VSAGPTLRIALPGLPELLHACLEQGGIPRMPAAQWLVARGRRDVAAVPEWRRWLLAGAGLGPDVLERFPAGPCSRLVQGGTATGTWARAEPVHLLTAIDHLQLAAPVPLPLEPLESETLLKTLNEHLAGSGFGLFPSTDGGWLCQCPPGLEYAAIEPALAIGRNLREALPAGRDAARVQALVVELQMLLHEHPCNERRTSLGRPVVNSVWLWGFGAGAEPQGAVTGALLGNDPWLAGLWRLHGGRVEPLEHLAQAVGEETAELRLAQATVATGGDPADELRQIELSVFAPARDLLATGRLRSIALHAGNAVLEVAAGARWMFWRRARPLTEVLA
jgi:hypothetical protein